MKRLENKTNVAAPDAEFPYGDVKDNTGSNNGTPVNRDLVGDLFQLLEKMFDYSGLTANGLPDNETNGFQLFEAFRLVFAKKYVKQVTSVFDNDTVTITRDEIETAFVGVPPFWSKVLGSGTSENSKVDLSVSVWYLNGAGTTWVLMPNTDGVGGANISINAATGDIDVALNVAPVDPATPVRIVIQG